MSETARLAELPVLERLLHLSRRDRYDVYKRFDWPPAVDRGRMWCDEDLLTTYGTEVHEKLDAAALAALSQWECIHFFSLNVHGIKGALAFVMRAFYEPRYRDFSDYLHVFVEEENAHMWFFAKFCLDYAGKIYPAIALPAGAAADPAEQDLYMFASTLIFEEYVDYYNHKVGRNAAVPPLVREINHQHHQDEARHISFGREIVKRLHAEVTASDPAGVATARVRRTLEKIFVHFIGLMYNPKVYADAGIVQAAGMPNPVALRNQLRNDPARRPFHLQWFRRPAEFFVKQGMLADTEFLAR